MINIKKLFFCVSGTPGSFRMNCDGSRPVVTVAPTLNPGGRKTTTTKRPEETSKIFHRT